MKRAILITSLLTLFIGCKKVEIENEDYEQFKETEMAVLPEENITTTMVGNALGTSSRNVGELCTHPNINMWAKFKPVRWYNKLSPYQTEGVNRYKGSFNNCGIKFVDDVGGELTGTLTFTQGNMDKISNYNWGYDRLVVSSNYPASIGMFIGYNKQARPIIRSGLRSGSVIDYNIFNSASSVFNLYFTLNSEESYQENELSINDLVEATGMQPFNPAEFYMACRVKAPNGSTKVYAQDEKLGATTSPEIRIPVGSDFVITKGDYRVDCFLADGYHTDSMNALGLISRIAPLWSDSLNVNRFTLRVSSSMPASCALSGIGAISSFYTGTTGTNLINDIQYAHPSYYDDLESDNYLPTRNYNNIAFKLVINPTANFTLSRLDFYAYNGNPVPDYPLHVQLVNETYAKRDSSTISFSKGESKTIYLISSVVSGTPLGSGPNSIQLGIRIKSADVAQTPWINLSNSL